MTDLSECKSRTGALAPVFRVFVQTRQQDTYRILDAVMKVDPLAYGRYLRNGFVSAVGSETHKAQADSTTAIHSGVEDQAEYFDCVELSFSVDRDVTNLAAVLDAVRDAHHYEEPVMFVQELWASRAIYDPTNNNPNRWWNEGKNDQQENSGKGDKNS